MSKVDDSSDAQRIKEMNEAQFRRRADNEKRGKNARLEKSFKQVMTDRGQRRVAQHAQAEQAKQDPAKDLSKRVLDKVRQEQPKAPHELARRAAMSKAMHKGLAKTASRDVDQHQRAEVGRGEELVTQRDGELEQVDRTSRDEEDRDVRQTDERQSEVEQARRDGDPLAPIGEDDPRRQPREGRGGGGRGGEDRGSEVAGAKGAGGANAPQLPPEVLEQIVSAIYKGVSQDGRTHMQITLKGGMFDGVSLSVRSNGGKVSCEFSGCGRDLGRLLDSTKGALARGLSKRGLKLERLSAR